MTKVIQRGGDLARGIRDVCWMVRAMASAKRMVVEVSPGYCVVGLAGFF